MLRLSCNARAKGLSSVLLKQIADLTTVAAAVHDNEDNEWVAARPFRDIPGPKALPLVGNAWRYMKYIGEYSKYNMYELHDKFHQDFGDIVRLSGMPGTPETVFLFDPEDIEKALRNEGKWPSRDFTPSFTYYRNVTRKDLFQGVGSILATQGEEWQKFRSKVNPAMMQPRNTKLYVAPIDDVAIEFVDKIRRLKDKNDEMPEKFQNEFNKWALESITLIALDKRLGCMADNLDPESEQQHMINAAIGVIECMGRLDFGLSFYKYFSTSDWRLFVKYMDTFTDVAWKYVTEAMERIKSKPADSDDYSVLERILLNDSDPKVALVTALDMMFGGIDTTAAASGILLYYLATNPDKQEKLYQELKRILPNSKRESLTPEKMEDLKYLKACNKEALRLTPVAFGNGRTLTKNLVLSNYQVPKGTNVFMMHKILSNKEKNFPQADKFIPERWLKGPNGEPSESRNTHPFVYMPFGFGVRMCLGRRFAELEMDTLIARIIRNFKVEYHYGPMEYSYKLITKPASPLKFKMIEREE